MLHSLCLLLVYAYTITNEHAGPEGPRTATTTETKTTTKAAKDAACLNAVERLIAPLLLEILLPCVRAEPCSL